MAEHTLYGKRKLCYTEVTDFTDFQGIGRDPLYKRFDSVYSVIDKYIEADYKGFLAHPIYSSDEDQIMWYVNEWNTTPQKYSELSEDDKARYSVIKEKTIAEYNKLRDRLSGEDKQILSGALKYIDEDFMFCYDNKIIVVAWGMTPDSNKHIVKGAIIHDLKLQDVCKVRFNAGHYGQIDKISGIMNRPVGFVLSHLDIPKVVPNKGYSFKGWEPEPIGMKVVKPLIFEAIYEKDETIEDVGEIKPTDSNTVEVEFISDGRGLIVGPNRITLKQGSIIPESDIPSVEAANGYIFDGWSVQLNEPIYENIKVEALYSSRNVSYSFTAGEFGEIDGLSVFSCIPGSVLPSANIPNVKPNPGYKFVGWDKSPFDFIVENDTIFTAQYQELKAPWYKRIWLWFSGKGCLKWLLYLLLFALLLWLLFWILRGCSHDSHNVVLPIDKIETSTGEIIDNNGPIRGIIGDDGQLPDNSIIAPITGDDGQHPPIVENPGAPDIIGNRLNIYFDDENVDLNAFVTALGRVYSTDECQVIGVDQNIPMIQILVPESLRDRIRETINSKIPDFDFFVVDESIFTIVGRIRDTDLSDAGWHLKAVKVKDGWNITKGKANVIVAVVDDGIDASHDILKDRIVKPYNVFTQNNHLSAGEGHGTHVAGLAVGSDVYYDKGVSGIAPKCSLMPVQVFDNGVCTFSSVTSGIMYAIHNGASVVNVSIGPNFRGLDILPITDQDYIARTQFKNEERVWKRIIQVANEKNVIIVFAVGNDNILANIPPENRTNYTLNVAAVDKNIHATDFTNYGTGSNISAPGMNIVSSVPVNKYASYDGTSMAAPIVAGTVALMKSCVPDISVTDVLYILQRSGYAIAEYVPPMIQVDAALQMLLSGDMPGANTEKVPPGSQIPGNDDQARPEHNDIEDNNGQVGGSAPGPLPSDTPSEESGTDYDAIRRLIESYKQKIKELEKLLPENK